MDPITSRDVKAIFFMRPIDFYGPNHLGHGQIEAAAGFLYPRSPHSKRFLSVANGNCRGVQVADQSKATNRRTSGALPFCSWSAPDAGAHGIASNHLKLCHGRNTRRELWVRR